MKGIDSVIIEVGSTITKAVAVGGLGGGEATLLARGDSLTSVSEGDVLIGVQRALADLVSKLNGHGVIPDKVLACSSAAGGLRMAAIGLAEDMTVRAAREACLGAGAVLRFVHGGKLKPRHLEQLTRDPPSVILLAGGTDGGDEETILHNSAMLADTDLTAPLVYAGNARCVPEALEILESYGGPVRVVENIYPRIDVLNVQPARQEIQGLFSQHIVRAPGMARLRQRVEGIILPVPAAVMRSSELLAETGEEVLVVDAGGATTDVHSVTDGDPKRAHLLTEPQPRSKRTVEGDLGVYWNAAAVQGEDPTSLSARDLRHLRPIPKSPQEIAVSLALGRTAVGIAVNRHGGRILSRYTATGRVETVMGKDLTAISLIVGTGGVLCRLSGGLGILRSIPRPFDGVRLLPTPRAALSIDSDYVFSAAGVLASISPQDSLSLIRKSLKR